MSHLVELKVQLDDMKAIKDALEEMGFEVREGKHKLSAYGWNLNCDLSIKKDGKQLMVGFTQKDDKTIEVQADWHGTRISRKEFQKDLQQLHAKHKARNVLKKRRWSLGKEQVLADGSIQFTATRWA